MRNGKAIVKQELIQQLSIGLHAVGAVKLGSFTLHSGKLSPIYLDLRLLASHPQMMKLAARAYSSMLEPLEFDRIAGVPLAGLPIATAVSLEMDRPMIYPRSASKSYGTGKLVEGDWSPGQRAVVVDDVATSGDSLLQGIALLEKAGLEVRDAVVLIDRQQGGEEKVASAGYRLHSLVTLRQLLDNLQGAGIVSGREKSNILEQL